MKEERRRRRNKKDSLKFPIFPSCPESFLPDWPGAGGGQTMK